MVYNRLFWSVLVRVVLLTLNAVGLGLVLVFLSKEDVLTIAFVAGLLGVQVVLFVSAFNRVNRDLSLFFASVYSLDSSISFRDSLVKKQFAGLYENLMKVNAIVGGLKINLEEQNQYYKSITNHAPTPIISYYDNGKIGLINAASKELLGVEGIRNIKEIENISEELFVFLMNHEKSDQQVLKTKMRNEAMSLMIKMSSITIRKNRIRIASIQNIESELDHKEIESWQRLLKVLTHEIANSIGPISSTIDTLSEVLEDGFPEGNLGKMKTGLDIIGERSQGLLQLLADIRRFSSFPPPKNSEVNVVNLFETTIEFLREELAREDIEVEYEATEASQSIWADQQLITHVLINLISNAKEALLACDNKKIKLRSNSDDLGFVYLRVIDNGPGINSERIEQIFIPFYTSKDTGSGIGLSLSREIMRLHGGTIGVNSQTGHTEFIMKFNPHLGL